MKEKYEAPEIAVKEFANFENVFTYCDKGNAKQGCAPVTDSGNAADAQGSKSAGAAFSGAGVAAGSGV